MKSNTKKIKNLYKKVCKTKKVCVRKHLKTHYKKQNQFGGMSDDDILKTITQKKTKMLNVNVIKKDKLNAVYVRMAEKKISTEILLTNGIATCMGIGFSFIDEKNEYQNYLAHLSPIDIDTPETMRKLGDLLDKKKPNSPIFLFRSSGFSKIDLPVLKLLYEKGLLDNVDVYSLITHIRYYDKNYKLVIKQINEWDKNYYYGLNEKGTPIGYYFE